ncbi:polysaccharide deacetylase family protein [Reinekea marinisedimentorum]|uniref:Polysaccharide deacetylase n=1 Tax=Reinekea marinisedimentorum TaxID=230495 RepID=A0A4R3I4Y2_9GAMM|nr:polysaccharide deacetylase family protein [Reinekea marinisedimentorum]TCS40302.1 polysaccharide deacetylase [Reinekea marinisedimentorum]
MIKSKIVSFCNGLSEAGAFTGFLAPAVPVFMIHRVHDLSECYGGISVDYLRRCLTYIKQHGYRVLTLDELYEFIVQGGAIPRKVAVFTIDDGFIDHYKNAARVFDEYGYPLNFFLVTDLINKRLWPWDDQIAWAVKHSSASRVDVVLPDGSGFSADIISSTPSRVVERLREALKCKPEKNLYSWIEGPLCKALGVSLPSTLPEQYEPMSWANARDLVARGHGVYAHTVSHRILSQLDSNEIEAEVAGSIDEMKSQNIERQDYFVYPTGRIGDFNEQAKQVLCSQGIKLAFSTEPDYAKRSSDTLSIPRFSLPSNFVDFMQYLTKFEQFKSALRAKF